MRNVLVLLLFAGVVVFPGCSRSRVKEGDRVRVRVLMPPPPPDRLATFVDCDMEVSHLYAVSKKFGMVSTRMPAIVDPGFADTAGIGTSVLDFHGNSSIDLPASDDWEFHYVGLHGNSCTPAFGDAFISHGMTGKISVMSKDVVVPMTVETFTDASLDYSMSLTLTKGTSLVAATLQIPTDGGTGCSGTYDLALGDGTVLVSGFSYSFPGSPSPSNGVIRALPRKTPFVLTLDGTHEIKFTTGDSMTETIVLPDPGAFCP